AQETESPGDGAPGLTKATAIGSAIVVAHATNGGQEFGDYDGSTLTMPRARPTFHACETDRPNLARRAFGGRSRFDGPTRPAGGRRLAGGRHAADNCRGNARGPRPAVGLPGCADRRRPENHGRRLSG